MPEDIVINVTGSLLFYFFHVHKLDKIQHSFVSGWGLLKLLWHEKVISVVRFQEIMFANDFACVY